MAKTKPVSCVNKKSLQVQDETKRCVDIIMSESRVPGVWQIMLRDAILAKERDDGES